MPAYLRECAHVMRVILRCKLLDASWEATWFSRFDVGGVGYYFFCATFDYSGYSVVRNHTRHVCAYLCSEIRVVILVSLYSLLNLCRLCSGLIEGDVCVVFRWFLELWTCVSCVLWVWCVDVWFGGALCRSRLCGFLFRVPTLLEPWFLPCSFLFSIQL